MRKRIILFLIIVTSSLSGCEKDETVRDPLRLLQVFVGTAQINLDGAVTNDIPLDRSLTVIFSSAVDQNAAVNSISLQKSGVQNVVTNISFLDAGKTVLIHPVGLLDPNSIYILNVSAQLKGAQGETFPGRSVEFKTIPGSITITSIKTNDLEILHTQRPTEVPVNDLEVDVTFSAPVDPATADATDFSITGYADVPFTITLSNENKTVTLTTTSVLSDLRKYELQISEDITGVNQESFSGYTKLFYTQVDPTPDFPLITDEELITLIQQQTFRYFWDFGHPASGMARERNSSGNIITSGGSGFGLMAIIVGIERNFITRLEGLERMEKILTFLESADRFHGAYSHWIDGNSGNVVPFSANDNGGDLVETSFLMQGLLTFRQYLDPGIAAENDLIIRINALWKSVEWNWYTRDGQDVLYWHWSPDKAWIMNHQVTGYNESLITYLLAASSPTYSIDATVYHQGWANNGGIVNGKTFYGINLPLGFDYGGPLFFSHYSFLGLDPRALSDMYANYWNQNVSHTLINHAYVVTNPEGFVGYSEENWGLTASDNHQGYSAHSPTHDLGVISPTAAISSLPYTPEESMKAIRFFYYTVGDRLWGPYGFYDAFNITEGWTADSYLAIDQGPMIIMIENYRTGLLWDLFMSAPEIQGGLNTLGFTY